MSYNEETERTRFETVANDLEFDVTRHPDNSETYIDNNVWLMWWRWNEQARRQDESI